LTTPNGNVWPRFRVDPRFRTGLQPVENWVSPTRLRERLAAAGFSVVRQEGRPVYEFRIEPTGCLQHRRIERAFVRCRLASFYHRTVAPTALYQCVAARRAS